MHNVLVINSGSSSLKFAVIDADSDSTAVQGVAEQLGTEGANVRYRLGEETVQKSLGGKQDHEEAISEILNLLSESELLESVKAAGHRVVHGGEKFREPCIIDDQVIAEIEQCIVLSPNHNPANLMGIKAVQARLPALTNVAVFDTAFHHTMPEEAWRYPVPFDLYTDFAVRRYGFHGISCQYVSQKAYLLTGLSANDSALIIAHLGNGCSATAVLNGRSHDTTMGLTPLEGLVMGTRSGSVDPNIYPYLIHQCGYDEKEVTDMLNNRSGLLALSGLSNDCREITEAADNGDMRAEMALTIFCYVLAKHIAGLVTTMGRLDLLVFTGGIGENSTRVRAMTLDRLKCFNFSLDNEKNQLIVGGKQGCITSSASTAAWVIATNEELMISQATAELTQ